MTKQEKRIYELIRETPSISQNELAKIIGIKRSSVANHIRSLMTKGYIKGREYIFNDMVPITVLGGINISFYAYCENAVSLRNSNPANISSCAGGVARNISENLSKLDKKIRLLSAVGDDIYGKNILRTCRNAGVLSDDISINSSRETGTYFAIMSPNGDIFTSVSDMSVIEDISIEYVKSKINFINQSDILILDANLSKEVIEYVFSVSNSKKIYFHAVSISKVKRAENVYSKISTFAGHVSDLAFLLDININNKKDIFKAIKILHKSGVKNVYLFDKADIIYLSRTINDITKTGILNIAIKNNRLYEFGMDEAFFSGIIYSDISGFKEEETILFSSACRYINGLTSNCVSEAFSLHNIKSLIDEKKINITYKEYCL